MFYQSSKINNWISKATFIAQRNITLYVDCFKYGEVSVHLHSALSDIKRKIEKFYASGDNLDGKLSSSSNEEQNISNKSSLTEIKEIENLLQ